MQLHLRNQLASTAMSTMVLGQKMVLGQRALGQANGLSHPSRQATGPMPGRRRQCTLQARASSSGPAYNKYRSAPAAVQLHYCTLSLGCAGLKECCRAQEPAGGGAGLLQAVGEDDARGGAAAAPGDGANPADLPADLVQVLRGAGACTVRLVWRLAAPAARRVPGAESPGAARWAGAWLLAEES